LTAFLTVVDLFATQAILPSLTRAYRVMPAAMGFAVNASTMGMAVAGLIVSVFSQHIDRRFGILVSLALLSIPTALLAIAPDLTTFTVLRIAQGLCMASAFTLTLAYLGEECSAADAGGAFAAYITGNVASNLIGRLISAALADHLGLAWNFYFFAALNLAGAVLVYFTVARAAPMEQTGMVPPSPFAAWLEHLANPQLRATFGIGFCILFAFIGTFTYVNFVLVRPPLSLGPMGRRLAAASATKPGGGLAGHDSHRRGDLLRPGDGDRLRQPRCDRGPRGGERHLSRLLLRRRPGRHSDPGANLRPDRMAGLRCWNRPSARRRGCARASAETAGRSRHRDANRMRSPR